MSYKGILSYVGCLLTLVLLNAESALGNGSYAATQTSTSDGTGLPSPASDSGQTGEEGFWAWSISGSDGAYSAEAEAQDTDTSVLTWNEDASANTGLHSASGFQEKRIGEWNPGTCTVNGQTFEAHGVPGNALATGSGDGTVTCDILLNPNNGEGEAGSASAYAYASLSLSGVANDSCDVVLDGSLSEGNATITGTLAKSPSITITGTVNDDEIGHASGTNTCSDTKQTNPAQVIAGLTQSMYGVAVVRASIHNGAAQATANADTVISSINVRIDYRGTGPNCTGDQSHSH